MDKTEERKYRTEMVLNAVLYRALLVRELSTPDLPLLEYGVIQEKLFHIQVILKALRQLDLSDEK